MPINSVSDWSQTAASNSDIGGIALGEGVAAIREMNDALRQIMKQIADWRASPTFIGAIDETIYTITDGAAFEIDPGNGGIQKITLGASRTPKFTNFADGESMLLLVNDGTSYTITWTDSTAGSGGVDWKDGGSAPTLDATRLTGIILFKENGRVHGVNAGTFSTS